MFYILLNNFIYCFVLQPELFVCFCARAPCFFCRFYCTVLTVPIFESPLDCTVQNIVFFNDLANHSAAGIGIVTTVLQVKKDMADNRLMRVIEEIITQTGGGRALEIGCGAGSDRFTAGLSDQFRHVVALDYDAEDIKKNMEQALGNVVYINGNGLTVEFERSDFDVIVIQDFRLHLMDDDLFFLLERCRSWLSPSGVVVVLPGGACLQFVRIFYKW